MKMQEAIADALRREYEMLRSMNAVLSQEYLSLLQQYGIQVDESQEQQSRRRRGDSPSS